MKKIMFSVLAAAVILGGTGTYALANSSEEGNGLLNFGQMKPYIEEMHPNLSTKEQKEMFDRCHGTNGVNPNFENQNMMNNFHSEDNSL